METKWYPVSRLTKLTTRLFRINTFLREQEAGLYDGYNKRGFGADINGIPCETLEFKELKKKLEEERDDIEREIKKLSESSIQQ